MTCSRSPDFPVAAPRQAFRSPVVLSSAFSTAACPPDGGNLLFISYRLQCLADTWHVEWIKVAVFVTSHEVVYLE